MSLTGALFNAFSGLTANARAASLVATNIANATTESYGRRTLELSSQSHGTIGGVRIDGVMRHSDPVLIADRRLSDADLGRSTDLQSFALRMEDAVGASDRPGSLMSRFAAFENALILAGNNPASEQRLENVATAAQDLARSFQTLSGTIQNARREADRKIGLDVEALNTALAQVDRLNKSIGAAMTRGTGDISSLHDERQRVIDGISDIVPLRVVERERGAVSLSPPGERCSWTTGSCLRSASIPPS